MTAESSQLAENLTVSAADIEAYLRAHPDFFHYHDELLEVLKVPHSSGEAVSLVTRQMEVLREKNRRLHSQLNEIVQIARDNDGLYQRIHQFTLALLNAAGLQEALASVDWGLNEYFQADFVAVRVLEPVVETPVADLGVSSPDDAQRLFGDVFSSGNPSCGKPSAEQADFLFGASAPEVLSFALVPMLHAGLKGLLAIGSRNASRFHPGMGNMFLTQMGEVVGARLAALIHRPD